MKAFRLFLFFLMAGINSFAQGFGVDTVYKFINKTTASSTPPHEYFQLNNNGNGPINMRWKIDTAATFYPAQWSIAIQDNTSYHNPAPDSADFVLPAIAGSLDKIIINVYHNQVAGDGEVHIDLINLDSTAQVIRIVFDIRIAQANGMAENEVKIFPLYPNPGNGNVKINTSGVITGKITYSVCDALGRIIKTGEFVAEDATQEFNFTELPKGLYRLVFLSQYTDFIGVSNFVIE